MCPGCGVGLQREDANAPGYYVTPRRALEAAAAAEERNDEDDAEEASDAFEFEDGDDDMDDDAIDETYVPPGFYYSVRGAK